MRTEIIELGSPHSGQCRVCGGKGRVQVAELRARVGLQLPAWVLARVLPCPLSSAADGLRALLGLSGYAPVGPGGAA